MSFGASIAVLVLAIAVIVVVAFAYASARPKARRRKAVEEPFDSLSDPPTITHYGHG